MMRTKTRTRFGRAVAAVAALSIVAAACGGDDDDVSDVVDDAEETVEDAVDEAEDAADEAMDEAEDAADEAMDEAEDVADEAMDEADEAMDEADDAMDEMMDCDEADAISLQLQWFTQAQFAGYFAAQDQGIYEDYCLDVEIVEGGVEIVPQTQLANGAVDFALAWVPKALASREAGANIVNIAQIFQRSGTLQVSFADAGITSPEDFEGRTIGNWGFGNEYEVYAALGQAGLDPATDV
jgi:NitT/TauT family transport system substrate-binding protein